MLGAVRVGRPRHLARLEHGVLPDGTMAAASDRDCSAFYQETGAGRYVPRSIFLDLEPSVMDEVRRELVVVVRKAEVVVVVVRREVVLLLPRYAPAPTGSFSGRTA